MRRAVPVLMPSCVVALFDTGEEVPPAVSPALVEDQPPLPTGLHPLDRATGGGSPGNLWVVGGPDAVGKTLFTLGLARAAALRAHVPVRWIATNEEPEMLAARVLSAEARITVERPRGASLSSDEQARMATVESKIDQAKMTFSRVPAGRLVSAVRGS